ncbi:unnamed protein product [Hymenolepis diminuta]|uniref:Uncharacterized protein n=1 Tax=Hymenolepis diminuta TaxID=6216 RepID=A0A564Y6P3_HYMDI|nr:unnamed protein product [Hymenolepis diminuta]
MVGQGDLLILKWALQKSLGEGTTEEILDAFIFLLRTTSHPALNDHSSAEILTERNPRTICSVHLSRDSTFLSLPTRAKKTLTTDTAVYIGNHRPNGTWAESIIRARRGGVLYEGDVDGRARVCDRNHPKPE